MNTTICRISDNDPPIGVHCQRGGLKVWNGKLVKEHTITVKNLQEKQSNLVLVTHRCWRINATTVKMLILESFTILLFKGWFPLSCNFSLRTQLTFTCVNKIEAMYETKREWSSSFSLDETQAKRKRGVERRSTFTLPLSYLRASGNPP